ncbi:atpE, partial [Symbiodinium microadriaticum]
DVTIGMSEPPASYHHVSYASGGVRSSEKYILSTSVRNLWSETARIHKMQDFKQLVPLAVAIFLLVIYVTVLLVRFEDTLLAPPTQRVMRDIAVVRLPRLFFCPADRYRQAGVIWNSYECSLSYKMEVAQCDARLQHFGGEEPQDFQHGKNWSDSCLEFQTHRIGVKQEWNAAWNEISLKAAFLQPTHVAGETDMIQEVELGYLPREWEVGSEPSTIEHFYSPLIRVPIYQPDRLWLPPEPPLGSLPRISPAMARFGGIFAAVAGVFLVQRLGQGFVSTRSVPTIRGRTAMRAEVEATAVADRVQLKILSPEGEGFTESATEVILPSASGQLGILANHAPMMSALDVGVLRYKQDDGQSNSQYQVQTGIWQEWCFWNWRDKCDHRCIGTGRNMAFHRLFNMISLPAVVVAETFSATPGQLEASMTLKTDGAWHLGGFCFGQADSGTSKAAEIRAHVEWAGSQPLGATGPVMLAAFDAREHRWGAVKDAWGQMSCEEKLNSANMKRQLGKTHDQKSFNFRIHVHQTSAARDWHFALLTCGETEQADLTLRLVATSGVLNMFEASTHFDSSSCPAVVDVPWMEAAHDEVGFWLLLVGAVVLGGCMVLSALACRHCRKEGRLQRFRETSVAGGAEPVIGKPCSQIGEAKCVVGQTTDMAVACDQHEAPESRV